MSLIAKNNLKTSYFKISESWESYRDINSRKPKPWRVDRTLYRKIIELCFRKMAFYWTHSVGGVYVRGFGYFALFRAGKSRNVSNYRGTNGYYYNLVHIPIKPNDFFGGFKLRSSSNRVSISAHHQLKNGMRYSIHYDLLKNYLKKERKHDL